MRRTLWVIAVMLAVAAWGTAADQKAAPPPAEPKAESKPKVQEAVQDDADFSCFRWTRNAPPAEHWELSIKPKIGGRNDALSGGYDFGANYINRDTANLHIFQTLTGGNGEGDRDSFDGLHDVLLEQSSHKMDGEPDRRGLCPRAGVGVGVSKTFWDRFNIGGGLMVLYEDRNAFYGFRGQFRGAVNDHLFLFLAGSAPFNHDETVETAHGYVVKAKAQPSVEIGAEWCTSWVKGRIGARERDGLDTSGNDDDIFGAFVEIDVRLPWDGWEANLAFDKDLNQKAGIECNWEATLGFTYTFGTDLRGIKRDKETMLDSWIPRYFDLKRYQYTEARGSARR